MPRRNRAEKVSVKVSASMIVLDLERVGEIAPFDVSNFDPPKYKMLIERFTRRQRDVLKDSIVTSLSPKPLLRRAKQVRAFKYFEVMLTAEEASISCRFLECNLYLIGFCTGNGVWYELSGWCDEKFIVPNNDMIEMYPKIKVDYEDLEMEKPREKLSLDKYVLADAVYQLNKYPSEGSNSYLKTSLLVLCQMIQESIRFPNIQTKIYDNYNTWVILGKNLLTLENQFKKFSKYFTGNSIMELLGMADMNMVFCDRIVVVMQLKKIEYETFEGGHRVHECHRIQEKAKELLQRGLVELGGSSGGN